MVWAKGRDLPNNWHHIQRQIKTREHNPTLGYPQCQFINPNTGNRCTNPGTEVHHTGNNNNHNPASLALLCHWHHTRITTVQAAKAHKNKNKTRNQGAPHPGIKTTTKPQTTQTTK